MNNTSGSHSIAPQIVEALIANYGAKPRDGYLRYGKCPQCGRRELWASSEAPWIIRCGRLNKCGFEATARELFPDFYHNFSKRYAASPANPNATADAYLQYVRGLEIRNIKGWYSQEKYWHPKGDRGSATVRFALNEDVYFERLVDSVNITLDDGASDCRRANFHGKYRGLWWQPPGFEPIDGSDVYLVEGIIDALTLIQSGVQAVATLTCNNYPAIALAALGNANKLHFVWALDNDKSGRQYSRKHIAQMREAGLNCSAALIKQSKKSKTDWNDLLISGDLTPERIIDTISQCRHQGDLLMAQTAQEKGALIYLHTRQSAFWFEHSDRLYWFEYSDKAVKQVQSTAEENKEALLPVQALKQAGLCKQIANCFPECLYHEISTVNDEFNRYYLRIRTPTGRRPIQSAFSGAQLAAAGEFKKRLLSVSPGAMYLGNAPQLDNFMLTTMHNLPSVEVFDACGYSNTHQAYIFHELGVKNGKVTPVNDEDYMEFGKIAVKTESGAHLSLSTQIQESEWLNRIVKAYGVKGVVVLAYWIGALFSQQIRATHKSFPFLEIIGEPGSGKSTLLEYLWKLFGRQDYEGFDPSKSSLAARTRVFAQVSNLPVVLIESDREDSSRKFLWDELKTAYNGRALRSRGVKTGGNEVYEPPFRGALVISQNTRVDASEAIVQRIVGIELTRAGHSIDTAEIAREIERTPIEQVNGVLVKTIRDEAAILKQFFSHYDAHKQKLAQHIKVDRIVKNHAQLAALIDILKSHLGLSAKDHVQTQEFVIEMAKEREFLINSDTPSVAEFWELYEYLNSMGRDGQQLNHAKDVSIIAINLNHMRQIAAEHKLQMPPNSDLKRLLPASKRYRFTGKRMIRSQLLSAETDPYGKQLRCWTFKAQKGGE